MTALVARREDGVLKRLRTGQISDAEILAGTAAPAVAVAWAQIALGGVAAFALFGLAAPVNVVLVLAALVLGTAVFVLLAALNAVVTRSVEMAQLTTTPVLVVSLTLSGLYIPLDALPGPLEHLARVLPLTPVVDLLRLGLSGTAPDGHTVDLAGSFGPAAPPLLVLTVWVAAGAWATRRWFRWEPRR
jgi:ABC-2 type transport system permease protein